ncbi:MAG: flagellar hook-length control protein FliK [Oscillospiraceae bacterium]
MMNIANIISSMAGLGGMTDVISDTVSESPDVSFGEILGMTAAPSEEQTDSSTEILAEEPVTEEKKSFSVLVNELAEDIAKADDSVIDAAVKLLQAVGKAVEKLFGTGTEALDGSIAGTDSEQDGDTVTVFTVMLKMITADTEEEVISEETVGLDALLAELSDVIKAGLEEKTDPVSLAEKIRELLTSDDDETTALADAVTAVLCALSGTDIYAEEFEPSEAVNGVTETALDKLGSITDILSREISSYEKAALILETAKSGTAAESTVKFADYIGTESKSVIPELAVSVNRHASLRINDASAQIEAIRPVKQESTAAVQTSETHIQTAAAFAYQVQTSAGADISEETVAEVYKELGEIVNVQIAENIAEEIPESGVKELTVVLKPESLGEVAVKLTADENGTVSIILAASNPEVGKALSENAAALAESVSKQNVQVSSVNVVQPSEASSYMNLNFTDQGFNRRNGGEQTFGGSGGRTDDSAVQSINAADEIRAQKLLKEAKLWLTA